MRHAERRAHRHLLRTCSAWLAALLLYGCTGGLSCDGSTAACLSAYPYPQSALPNGTATVDNAVRVRMTQAGLDLLRNNLRDVLLAAFETDPGNPERLRVDLGPFELVGSSFANSWVGRRPNGQLLPTYAILDAASLTDQISFVFIDGAARGGLRVRLSNVAVGIDARVFAEWASFGTGACDLRGTACPASDPNCGIVTTLTLDIDIYPDVGQGAQCQLGTGECFLIDVQIADFALGDIDSDSLDIAVPPHDDNDCGAGAPPGCEPECSDSFPFVSNSFECDALCGAADFLTDVLAEVGGFLNQTLEPALASTLELAIRDALSDFDGAPLSASERYDLREPLSDVAHPTTLDIAYFLAPTGNAFDVNCPGTQCAQTRGMDLVLKTGYEAAPPLPGTDALAPPHPCVNPLEGADFAARYGASEFFAPDAVPLDGEYLGEPYHFGSSVARQGVNQALFAAYNTGIFCLEIDSDRVHALSEGAFPLTAGTLDLLTEGKLRQFAPPSAPAVLTLMPSGPPRMRYGAGTNDEGHMILEMQDVVVSFYVLVFERYTRVFAVKADISAELTLFADAATETLQLAIVNGPRVENFDESYNELLPGVDFGEVLGSLVGLAFDALLGQDLAFSYNLTTAISESLGVPLYVDFRGLETVPPVGTREFLNFYIALSNTPPPSPRMARLPQHFTRADAPLRLAAPHVVADENAPAAGGVTERSLVGEVALAPLDGSLPDDAEYFARVDFGPWRGPLRPSASGHLHLKDPKLALVGAHRIELRGRVAAPGAPFFAQGDLRLWTDPLAPRVALTWEAAGVRASGSDIGSPAEQLRYAFSIDHGPFGAFAADAFLTWADLAGARHLRVRAQDAAGNVSKPAWMDLRARGPGVRGDTARSDTARRDTARRAAHPADATAAQESR